MDIREATPGDNNQLLELQSRCPIGTTLIVSAVNTPDFFARVKAYENFKVFAAIEGDRIIGSAACAIRDAVVDGKVEKVGYEFQLFIDPEYRGRRIAGQLHQVRENYLRQQGAVLSYTLIMEGNIPSMRYIARQGFKHHRALVMPSIAVFKQMAITSKGNIRPLVAQDLVTVADLLNETWSGYELYEPMSADGLAQLISRTPGYNFDNIFVLENNGEITACLGFWDWSQITQLTVEKLSFKMRLITLFLNTTRLFRPMPRGLKTGNIMKQMVLMPIAFKDPGDLKVLLRYVNNQALLRGVEQIFCICGRDNPFLSSLQGLIHIDTTMNLFIKPLQKNISLNNKPVFINGIDL